MNIQTEDSHVWKAKCVRERGHLARTANQSVAPELSRSANERTMPTQELSSAHSTFSFKLHFGERKCAFASSNDQVSVAAQSFSGLAIEVDN